MRLDHIQMAIPPGGEAEARAFWIDLLGFQEIDKPQPLQGRGGLWLTRDGINLHLGVEDPFVPARKAHPCFAVADVSAVAKHLQKAGHGVTWDDTLPDLRRFFTADPFGNRVELMAEL